MNKSHHLPKKTLKKERPRKVALNSLWEYIEYLISIGNK